MKCQNKEFAKIWEKFREELSNEAERFDLEDYLSSAFDQAQQHARSLIPQHLVVLREGVATLLLLERWLSDCDRTQQRNAFLSQLSRALNCAICIRLLLEAGFEETARPLVRNYFESLDIAIACYVDTKFAEEFWPTDTGNYPLLWKQKIGYGKIAKYLRKACEIAGLDEDSAQEFMETRKAQKDLLSASVHADDAGAFRSMVVPVLGHPDKLSLNSHGVVSVHTPNQIIGVVGETYRFVTLVLKPILAGWQECPFDPEKEGVRFASFFVQAFSFQDYYQHSKFPDGDSIVAKDSSETKSSDG